MYIHIKIAPWSCFGSKTRTFNYLRRSKFMAASCDGHAIDAAGDSSYVFVRATKSACAAIASGILSIIFDVSTCATLFCERLAVTEGCL